MIRSLSPHDKRFGQFTNSSLSAALCLAGLYNVGWIPSTGAQLVAKDAAEESIQTGAWTESRTITRTTRADLLSEDSQSDDGQSDNDQSESSQIEEIPGSEVEENSSAEQLRERLLRLQEGARSIPPLPDSVQSALTARFPTLGSSVLDVQIAGYMAYVESIGTPDILIVGSSRSLQGIDPEALGYRLSGQGYDDLKVYNFSVNGATASVVNFILSELLPGETPPVVIWGDGSRAFNNGRRDRTWEAILSSPGYQDIRNGKRPVIAASPVEASDIAGLESALEDRAVASLLESLRNYAARPVASVHTANLGQGILEESGLSVLGFSAVGDRFDPRTYYQEFPKVNGQYDGAYSPFTLQGEQANALAEVAEFLRSQSSQLIFVNLPLSDSYLDDFRLYYEAQFQRFLQSQGTQHQFAVIDLLQAWQGQPALFADPSHINRDGASVIATQLSIDTILLSILNRQL